MKTIRQCEGGSATTGDEVFREKARIRKQITGIGATETAATPAIGAETPPTRDRGGEATKRTCIAKAAMKGWGRGVVKEGRSLLRGTIELEKGSSREEMSHSNDLPRRKAAAVEEASIGASMAVIDSGGIATT